MNYAGHDGFFEYTAERIEAEREATKCPSNETVNWRIAETTETQNMRPSHYTNAPFDVTEVQEYIFKNVLNAVPENRKAAAAWVLMAVKHLLRAGLKDDIFLELQKAENYLHRARTKEWLKDE